MKKLHNVNQFFPDKFFPTMAFLQDSFEFLENFKLQEKYSNFQEKIKDFLF